jgi:hypothetical protein
MTTLDKPKTFTSHKRLKTIEAFFLSKVSFVENSWVSTTQVFEDYQNYCDSNNLVDKALSQQSFSYLLKLYLRQQDKKNVIFDYREGSRIRGILVNK